jgi:hypothetical protein
MISPNGCAEVGGADDYDTSTVRLLSGDNTYCDISDGKKLKKKGSNPPAVLGQINGVRVCGKRAGSNYLETPHAIDDGVCPTGYKSCHETSSPPTKQNTWCIREEFDLQAQCPITNIKFV